MSISYPGFKLGLVVTLLLTAASAQAHQVWLEQDASGATLYFGEFADNLREASPGLLDKFVSPSAERLGQQGRQALSLTKTASGFALSATAARGESLVAQETRFPIAERQDAGKLVRSAYLPAARLLTSFDKQAPLLTLDLVPTGQHSQDGVELQVFYKGQALPKARVEVSTPLGWGNEYRANEQGRFTANLPWKGRYVLEVKHTDDSGGERAAISSSAPGPEKFDRTSYVTSLTVMQTEGWAALPSAPAAKPNEMK